jgi:hypothetical protein
VNPASQQQLSRHCHLMALNTCAHSSKISGREEARNYEEWQTALLRVLYKKGDQKEPQIIEV